MENLSRREFFEKFISRPQRLEWESDKRERDTTPILSRRSFIKFIGVMGAVVALEKIGVRTAGAQENKETAEDSKTKNQQLAQQKINIKESVDPADTQKLEPKDNSFKKTAIEQILMMIAESVVNAVFKELGMRVGNQSLSAEKLVEYLRDKPIIGLIKLGVLGPAIEEALFRALPDGFIDKNDRRRRWDIGIPTSILFALSHNLKREDSGELRFVESVPISQFMGGLFYWYLMRERGYSHAIFAHSMHNAIPLSIGILLFKVYPGEKALEIIKRVSDENSHEI